MREAHGVVWAICALALGYTLPGCSSGGGEGKVTSNPAAGVYAGVVLDDAGQPVMGAIVSIAGVEARSTTNSLGEFVVSDSTLVAASSALVGGLLAAGSAQPLEVSVLAQGYEPFLATLAVERGGIAQLELIRTSLEPAVTITSPTGEKPFAIPDGCEDPRVLVEGFVQLNDEPGFRLDILLVLDRSGSTGDPAFDVDGDGEIDTVLDAEKAAVECFLGTIDPLTMRVGLTTFNDEADQLVPFTSDVAEVLSGLGTLDGSSGGTNFEAAFSLARDLFLDLEVSDSDAEASAGPPEKGGLEPPPKPRRAILFLTDGIPTAHGVPRDEADSNLSQSIEDRQQAIAAAGILGQDTDAQLFAYSILSSKDANRKRTTLPHCVATCGRGRHVNISSVKELADELCGETLASVSTVTLRNVTVDGAPIVATLSSGGFFSELVPVRLLDGSSSNTIEVNATAFGGDLLKTASAEVVVRLVSQAEAWALSAAELLGAHAASSPVSASASLTRPTGGPVTNPSLYNFLVGSGKAEYEDAVELFGVETFSALDEGGGGAGTITLDIDFVFNRSCYQSDFGYVVLDSPSEITSAQSVLSSLPASQVLFNSGEGSVHNCDVGSIAAGTASYQVLAPVGKVIAFFILPHRTLADYKANPRKGKAPLFTISRLNPGGFDQVLTFRSEAGRTVAGSDTTVLTAGPLVIFAFEDNQVASGGPGHDFDDVVFTVRHGVAARLNQLDCVP